MDTHFTVRGVDGTTLAGIDFGGSGPATFVLLHGMMSRATTWWETAQWLTAHGRVIALDQRGHGNSDQPVEGRYDVSTLVTDAGDAMDQLGVRDAVLIGHSMGGLTAWRLAGQRPELVRALVIDDMTALAGDQLAKYESWFATWPARFTSLAQVRQFFGAAHRGQGEDFTEAMTADQLGYRPIFRRAAVLATIADSSNRDCLAELDQVRVPTLVVRGEHSTLVDEAELTRMTNRLAFGRAATVSGAGHVVHRDNPTEWRAEVESFVSAVLAESPVS